MRVLYLDLDSQRPDHLGCYGYRRKTSPNLDRVAAQGVRFDHCHAPDVPCLPSRTALFSGRFGVRNGVINHGGAAAEMYHDGPSRGFFNRIGQTSWMSLLRQCGMRTATVSPFGERHSAFHWYAGFNDIINTGKGGQERADETLPPLLDWVDRHAREEHWFLHANFWDPHTPYRTPLDYGEPFANDPIPEWLTEQVLTEHRRGVGPHSAREVNGFTPINPRWGEHGFPRQPNEITSMHDVRRMFDGYDTAVRYMDDHIGRLLNRLADLNVLDDTLIVVSADHGENLGELNIYGDHQTADLITTNVPLILRPPGGCAARTDESLVYTLDMAATVVELAGGTVPDDWDGRSFAEPFRAGEPADSHEYLVVSQGAWACQRGVRFRRDANDYLAIRSYHDGHHLFPDVMLFDVRNDPHEQHDLAPARPDLVGHAMRLLDDWLGRQMARSTSGVDPMWTVVREGGPLHTRHELPAYLDRLRATGRDEHAHTLAAKHPRETV